MEPVDRYDDLARLLEAVASPTRLAILHQLRAPRLVSDIRVQPSLSRAGENPARPLARQSVSHHVEQLAHHGLLQRVPMPDGRGDGYVLHHASLFALLEEVRRLGKLRSVIADDPTDTVARIDAPRLDMPPLPRLVVAYGREDGAAFALDDAPGRQWRIGRSTSCEIRLDHDPWISGEHATIERTPEGYAVTDTRSLNGTWLNWTRLTHGARVPLPTGALLMVGRTLLVLQT